MKNLLYIGIIMASMMISFSGCDMFESDTHINYENEDLNGDGIPDGNQNNQNSIRHIIPKGIDMSGAQGFVVFDNTNTSSEETRTTETESTQKSPYALYTIDENGQIKLTIFHFTIESDEEGNSQELKKEIEDALQLVPKLMTDMGNYILFSHCSIQIVNPEGLTEESLNFCNTILNNDEAFKEILGHSADYRYRLTYLVRKSDGAMFDLTSQPIFPYFHRSFDYINGDEVLQLSDGWWPDQTTTPLLSPDMYRISNKGNIFTSSGRYIYKISDNGDAIDVSRISQELQEHERFEIDDNENVFIPVRTVHGASADHVVHIYKSAGGFNMSDLGNGLYLDITKDHTGDPYLLGTRDHYNGFKIASLKDGNCSILCETEIDKDEIANSYLFYFDTIKDQNAFSTYLGYNNNEFRWFYGSYRLNMYSGVILSYNTILNKLELQPVPEEIEVAMRDKYDAISLGKYNVGVKLNDNSIEFTDIDVANGKVSTRNYEVNAMQLMVGKKCFISDILPTVIIYGKSTADGTDIHISVDLFTGEDLATFGTDTRNVISLLRIN